jgi:adhesin HecA-like repeat protein
MSPRSRSLTSVLSALAICFVATREPLAQPAQPSLSPEMVLARLQAALQMPEAAAILQQPDLQPLGPLVQAVRQAMGPGPTVTQADLLALLGPQMPLVQQLLDRLSAQIPGTFPSAPVQPAQPLNELSNVTVQVTPVTMSGGTVQGSGTLQLSGAAGWSATLQQIRQILPVPGLHVHLQDPLFQPLDALFQQVQQLGDQQQPPAELIDHLNARQPLVQQLAQRLGLPGPGVTWSQGQMVVSGGTLNVQPGTVQTYAPVTMSSGQVVTGTGTLTQGQVQVVSGGTVTVHPGTIQMNSPEPGQPAGMQPDPRIAALEAQVQQLSLLNEQLLMVLRQVVTRLNMPDLATALPAREGGH